MSLWKKITAGIVLGGLSIAIAVLGASMIWHTRTVTLHYSESDVVKINIESGSRLPDYINEKIVNGRLVTAWSTYRSGEKKIFDETVRRNVDLYPADYVSVMSFNPNGGNKVDAIIGKSGENIELPTCTRDNYAFLYWQNANGEIANYTTIPERGEILTAIWQAKIIFDENGGTTIDDIQEDAGTTISMPSTKKEGFVFAGWFDKDNKKTDLKEMPTESIILKAGWYKQGHPELCGDTEFVVKKDDIDSRSADMTLDVSTKLPPDGGEISIYLTIYASNTTPDSVGNLYCFVSCSEKYNSESAVSDWFGFIGDFSSSEGRKNVKLNVEKFKATSNKIYIWILCCDASGSSEVYINNVEVNVYLPYKNYLYL